MTSSQKLIVVLGANGTQGGSVLSTFATDPSWRVRALTRNVSSPKAQVLLSKRPVANIELVSADLNDIFSLAKAFAGAHAIFGVTDFWTLYGDDKIQAQAQAKGQPANELCFDLEVQQGKNIFDAASQIPTLERLVFSGLSNASELSGGKYKYVLHYDSKAVAMDYAKEELPELWAKTSVVQLGYYLENFLAHPWMIPRKDSDGTFIFTGPNSSRVDLPAGKHVIAYRELMPLEQFAGIWGKMLGVQAIVKHDGIGSSMGQIPEPLKKELDETFAYAEEFGFRGGDPSVIHPEDIGLKTGSVEDWVKAQDWSAVVGA
ncbi:hypothetical protein LTR70_010572 [Exophiala xenobiotica]|uniref:NmrA-like domain-containing protein n=1 Tax=Lithohypha guttulata TaxID=1690604 RepID=A0ABR0JU08_9EURO|nr:hypothetical protein LTR24_010538 [Lithohypha guttulata]KAK5309141.1 hypothetical protein LTR70_010572 [Exophiala xenobiotica]